MTGAIDATFSPAGATSNGFDGTVNSIALNATDVYVSGFVSAYKGVANSANGIAKLGLTSGAIDTVFGPVGPTANGVDDEVYTFTLGTSTCAVGCGTVLLLGGLFERYRGTPAGSLAILDPTTGAVK